jgi:putative ABC transport system ATP-binding protein
MRALAIDGRDLYRFFHTGDDEVLALRGVSISARPGEAVAVMGPSGSGKSTLLACLTGLDEPDGGTVEIDGERITRRPESTRAHLRARKIGVVSQSSNLVGHLTVRQNLRIVQQLAGREGRDQIDAVLARLGILERASAYPEELSGGEAVRAGLAAALINDPVVLVADEPTAEVDRAAEAATLALLGEVVARGAAIVVATHSDAVASWASRVVSMADGRAR